MDPRRTVGLIWLGFASTPILLFGILYLMLPVGQLDWGFYTSHPIGMAMVLFAIANLGAARLIPRMLLNNERARREIQPDAAQMLEAVLPWAMYEFVTLLGVIASVMTHQLALGTPLIALGWTMVLLARPHS
jgi:hypothetical protein